MAKTDKITQGGKILILGLLQQVMLVEYGMILNYPRILDQITNIGKSQPQEFIENIERLGKDSFRHSTVVMTLIEDLGGKPDFSGIVIDRMIDVSSMLVEQLGKEKLAMSMYKEAKLVPQNNQVRSRGFLGKLLDNTTKERQWISRNRVIQILEGLESDEFSHIKRTEMALLQINITPEVQGKEFTQS